MMILWVIDCYVCATCLLLSLVYFYMMLNSLDKKSREAKSNNILAVSEGILVGRTYMANS